MDDVLLIFQGPNNNFLVAQCVGKERPPECAHLTHTFVLTNVDLALGCIQYFPAHELLAVLDPVHSQHVSPVSAELKNFFDVDVAHEGEPRVRQALGLLELHGAELDLLVWRVLAK